MSPCGEEWYEVRLTYNQMWVGSYYVTELLLSGMLSCRQQCVQYPQEREWYILTLN